jgi:nucleotide-binding universal stress UspA family protein
MKSIVACFDFSGVTSAVLETATALSTAMGAKLFLLHVVTHGASGIGFETVPIVNPDPAELLRIGREQLEGLREPIRQHGLDVSTVLLESTGNPASEILDEAEHLGADLIVMGSHGHGMMYHFLIGSTAEGVLKKAKCPVLFVPARPFGKSPERPASVAKQMQPTST